MSLDEGQKRFVGYLLSLAKEGKEDRGALADLRSGLGKRPGENGQVVAPVGPFIGLPDVKFFSAIHAEIKHPIRRKGKSFSASYAANVAANRRIRQPRSSPQDVPIFSARRFEIPLAGTKSSFDRHA